MTCEEALDRMLEADPGELPDGFAERDTYGTDAGATAELEVHIRSCERCAAVARTLRSELDALDAGLDTLARDGAATAAADAAADTALAAIRSDAGRDAMPLRGPDPAEPKGRARWTRRAWVPLAAAAALAAVLIVGQQEQPLPPSDAMAQTETIDPRVSVVPPADRGAAIMETGNPNITIVWLYEREES